MNLRLVLLSFMFLSGFVFSDKIYSQKKHTLAVYYKHLTKKNEQYRTYYPLGFGSTFSRNLSDKLVISAGLEYSHFQIEYFNKLAPYEYRSMESFNEAHYSLIAGLVFSILEKRLTIRGGGDIISTCFSTSGEVSRYKKTSGELDHYIKYTESEWDMGIRLKVDLHYYLSENLGIMVQPDFTHYLFTEARKSDYFGASVGMAIKF